MFSKYMSKSTIMKYLETYAWKHCLLTESAIDTDVYMQYNNPYCEWCRKENYTVEVKSERGRYSMVLRELVFS